ncbi:MAG: isoprenylcysteine carboxylmethyltransferase family protein [Proteobacteria bacterium]|nr:isoprenylcysteine carboxylmethyltransferase family protein [Pseudomonadota bacterium]
MPGTPGVFHLLLAVVVLQRIWELWLAQRNTHRLLVIGATEYGSGHYPLFIVLHAGWLLTLAIIAPLDTLINWPVLLAFVVLQAGRVWVITSLGRYWTTRILTIPGVPLVRRGPYRWVRHPNYMIVALELPLLPLVAGQWQVAAVFGVLNLLLLAYRMRFEDRVLAERRALESWSVDGGAD